jgi:PTS system galactitol-specific IIB component
MKRILVVCGTGVATSTIVVNKVREYLQSRGIEAQILQGKVMDLVHGDVDADLVVSTTEVPVNLSVPSVPALALLTGIGAGSVYQQIDEYLG